MEKGCQSLRSGGERHLAGGGVKSPVEVGRQKGRGGGEVTKGGYRNGGGGLGKKAKLCKNLKQGGEGTNWTCGVME